MGGVPGTRIEVMTRGSFRAAQEDSVLAQPIAVYSIDGRFTPEELSGVQELLTDAVSERSAVNTPVLVGELPDSDEEYTAFEVAPRPGVNDPAAHEVRRALSEKLERPVGQVSFSNQYLWKGLLDEQEYVGIQKAIGSNKLIHQIRTLSFKAGKPQGFELQIPAVHLAPVAPFKYISIDGADDAALLQLSKDRMLELNTGEMRVIQSQFREASFIKDRATVGLNHDITDAELEALAQSWSDHCKHKTFAARWVYTSEDPND